MAIAMARRGAAVALASRTVEQLERVRDEIEAAGGRAIAVPTDVSVSGEVNALVGRTAEAFGRVDIVVNNAGGSYPGEANLGSVTPIIEATDEHWQWGLQTNLSSTFYVCRAAIRTSFAGVGVRS
jgi:NAD(P)-dependent dehydrogenase (short-subunit alcohol dehydrogenase family)